MVGHVSNVTPPENGRSLRFLYPGLAFIAVFVFTDMIKVPFVVCAHEQNHCSVFRNIA